MILMTIRTNIYPEKQQEFMQTLLPLLTEIRKTTTCVDYDIYRAVEEHNSFCLVSRWQNQQQLHDHLRTKTFSVLLGAIQVLGNSPNITLDTISHRGGAEMIQAVRKKSMPFETTLNLRG